MKTRLRGVLALLVGLGLSLGVAGSSAAQEVPTGAARIVEKVQLQVLVGKVTLTTRVGRIVENNAGLIPGE